MFIVDRKRTPEQGHTARCLAHAMICAVENARDAIIDDWSRLMAFENDGQADANAVAERSVHDFRLWAQDNTALTWAEGYLADGTATCLCPSEEATR